MSSDRNNKSKVAAGSDESDKQNEITTQIPKEPEVITYTYEGDYETVEAHRVSRNLKFINGLKMDSNPTRKHYDNVKK